MLHPVVVVDDKIGHGRLLRRAGEDTVSPRHLRAGEDPDCEDRLPYSGG
jgi:hypothetical protein